MNRHERRTAVTGTLGRARARAREPQTGERAAHAAQAKAATVTASRQLRVTDDYIDAHFDQLVDCVVRASMSGEHFLVVLLWRHAARRAYAKRNLDQLAELFRLACRIPDRRVRCSPTYSTYAS